MTDSRTGDPMPPSALAEHADAIYFFMFDGWTEEMRSNRWHYASRFARHLPVVLVQPSIWSDHEAPTTEPEPRIPNCRILRVRSTVPLSATVSGAFTQARQIHQDIRKSGYQRPIFWTYSPDYVAASALLPSPLRVYHATENYFQIDNLTVGFHERLKALLSFANVVLGVSEGVAASHRPYTSGRVEVVTNGCDYAYYSAGGVDPEIAALRNGHRKLAVYAGNVNYRLDFDLMLECVRRCWDTMFVIVGPVNGLSDTDAALWRALLLEKNVSNIGRVPVERLPGIFGAADVGLIPYKMTPFLIENFFPLKAFEMLATGLPVVSTSMRELELHAGPGLRIAGGIDEFVAGVNALGRSALTDADRAALAGSARQQDYDQKFVHVCRILVEQLTDARPTAPGWALCGLSEEIVEKNIGRALGKLLAPTVNISDLIRSRVASRLGPYREKVATALSDDTRKYVRRLWGRFID